MNILKNRNVALRAPEPEDLDILYLWENDPSIWPISGTMAPFSRFILKQYLEHAGKDIFEMKQLRLIIIRNEDQRPLGAVDLFEFDPHHRRAGIGILIADRTNRHKGYAREALESMMNYCFSILKLHQLWCNIASGNQSSLNLFTAAGFEPVGEKKEWLFVGDHFEGEWILQYIHKEQTPARE